jgi:hypothetical protein
MIGGIYFAGGYFAGVLLSSATALAASTGLTVSTSATMTLQGAQLAATPTISVSTFATLERSLRESQVGISIGGINVRHRVRMAGLTIRDVLNDAPNTCNLTIEGDGPAVGQLIRITLNQNHPRVLFAGSIQTIDQSYESTPNHIAWDVTAIDDTFRANDRRPFGNFVDVSATDVAQAITPSGFSTAGIEAGLPNVSIVFDGSDTVIAALARLANAIGGYCKVEDGTIYLFLTDTEQPPDPIDTDHCFLNSPPIQINTDSSQLRTRVYGKGYGEHVVSDVNAGETLLPIQDGVQFTALGGQAIAALTNDGAQSERLAYGGVELGGGGSLVGPGAAPGNAPVVALAAGAGVTSGTHGIAVVFVTLNGKSLPGPTVSIDVGTVAPPVAAPVATAAESGTGPDQGSHDYVATFVLPYGETLPGPISNAITTSAAVGQLPTPSAPGANAAQAGTGIEDGRYDWATTYVNAQGETTVSQSSNQITTSTIPVDPPNQAGGAGVIAGGNLTANTSYSYVYTYTTTAGETLPGGNVLATTSTNDRTVVLPLPSGAGDPRITGCKAYRSIHGQFPQRLCGTFSKPIPGTINESMSDAAIASQPPTPSVDTSGTPTNRVPVYNISPGPAGTTARRVYRRNVFGGPFRLVVQLNDNTTTTYLDTKPAAALGADAPASNTTGTAFQKIPVSAIPLGPAGTTARKLYRRFNNAGPFKLATTIGNNTGTSFTDTVANAALGADAPITNTAIGNQIALTAIPTGATAVTARELYMSPVGGGTKKLATVISDNVTTTGTITASDATLAGAPPAPIADTSGLTQPPGQVNPGSTVIPVASASTFRTAGGWVGLSGGQVARYTGISGQTLTGIPETGPGAIHTTILYGSQALPAPMLIGVTGVTRPMLKGSAIHVWIQRDDLQAQAEQAARAGGDGVVEYLISDGRRAEESLTARCDADLAMFSRPIVTVAYATRDIKTKSGKEISVNLESPAIVATLTIQDVTITEIDIAPYLNPRFMVKASSVRFSLEDTLRRLIVAPTKL